MAFGGGCAVYFAFKSEPATSPLIIGAMVAAALWLWARRMAWARVLTLPLMLLSFMSESRRLDNQRMLRELGLRLRYPSVVEGLRA